MRCRLSITLALSALLLTAPSAPAAKIADTTSYGPLALAGNAVVYSVFRAGDAAARLRLARPGQESRLIFSQRLARGFRGEPTAFAPAASSRRVGLIAEQYRDIGRYYTTRSRELWTGRPTGTLKRIHPSRGQSRCWAPEAVAVAEDTLVTVESVCPPGAHIVVVRNYAHSGAPRTIARAERIKALAATGHFVAWVQRTYRTPRPHWTYTIVVYDRARNRVAYRIPHSGWPDHLSVQADGKIVGQSEQGSSITAWYSPAGQTRHDLPADGIAPRIGADRILYADGFAPAATGPTSLTLRDLAGHQTTVATFPARQYRVDPVLPTADYDGRRVAFLQKGCGSGNELWLLDANGPAYTAAACAG